MYGATTEEYWLDYQSLDSCMDYWKMGKEFQVEEARILVSTIAQALSGDKMKELPKAIISSTDQKPDREAFYRRYGDQIKRG